MSQDAVRYVLDVLENDDDLGSGPRSILWALAARANMNTAATYTGGWLCAAANMTPANVRRNVARLVDKGYIAADHRAGRSSVIRFPIAAKIVAAPPLVGRGVSGGAGRPPVTSDPGGRTDAGGQWHPSYCGCPECLEGGALDPVAIIAAACGATGHGALCRCPTCLHRVAI